MDLKYLVKFGLEESQEPAIKNPILREALEPRSMDQADLVDDLEPGALKDELEGKFDPSQETYEEYLRRINLDRPFNAAEGGSPGQLVTPLVDGSRPGYQGEESTFKDLSKVPPKIRKRFIKVTKYLEELIPKLNAGEKYYTKEQVSSMVEKKFGIKPRYKTTYASKGFPSDKIAYTKKVNQFEPKRYPVMRNLDPVETKIENTLKNMLIEDKPLNNFWYKALQERTGLVEQTIKNYINESPTFKAIKDQGALSLKTRFNKPDSHKFLKNLSFSEQLTQALEMEKGMPRFTGMGKLAGGDYTLSPKFKVMEFAKRNWHANRGKGLIKFFDKNGKRIDWAYGVELPYKDVSFSYGGKRHNIEKLNDIQYLKKNFSKVYETQTAINNLRVQEVDNPFGKGKISLEDLVKRNQVNGYKWSADTSTFDILHGKKGVKEEPFTNLNFNTRDVNQIEMGINRDTTLSKTQKNNLIKNINKLTGTGDPDAIIKRQVALAGDIKSEKITGYDDIRDNLIKLCRAKKASGGRIGYSTGTPTVACGANELNRLLKQGKGNTPLVKKILQGGGNLLKEGIRQLNPKEVIRLRNLIGPAALGFMAAYEGGVITDDVLRKGTPLNESVAKNWLTKSFVPFSEEFARQKNLLQSVTLTDNQKIYALDMMKAEKAFKEMDRIEEMKSDQLLEQGGYGMIDESQIITDEAIADAEANVNRILEDLDSSGSLGNTGMQMENIRAMDEMEASRMAKKEYSKLFGKWGTPLVNKIAKPPRRRMGPMTAKREMKVDYSLPTYDRMPTPTDQDILNYYKQSGIISPTEFKKGVLRPGEGTLIRMMQGGEGLYGSQFAGGGIAGSRRPNAIPPEAGPTPQGLPSMYNRVKRI